jgi:SH3-like domain-containing protein
MRSRAVLLILVSLFPLAAPAHAQDREVPYWASLRVDEVNLRVGPSADYPIDWVDHRAQLPMKVVRVREGWRLVEDVDGTQGWVVARLLSPERTALVVGKGLAAIRAAPAESGAVRWKAEPGVVGRLGKCDAGWCEFDANGRRGWVAQARLWGAGEP